MFDFILSAIPMAIAAWVILWAALNEAPPIGWLVLGLLCLLLRWLLT